MLQPLEPATDITKSPFAQFTIDELPERIAEQIHDMPSIEEKELWHKFKGTRILEHFYGYRTQPDDIEYSQTNDDWYFLGGAYYDRENSYGLGEYMTAHGFEWRRVNGKPMKQFYKELPKTLKTYVGWDVRNHMLGYNQVNIEGEFEIVPNFNPNAEDKPLIDYDPQVLGLLRAPVSGILCSSKVEEKYREFTGGLIDTYDLPFTDGGKSLPPIWQNRRLVGLLASWMPYDLEKSVIVWEKRFGAFEIQDVLLPVLRADIPEEFSIIVPRHRKTKFYARRTVVEWLDNENGVSGNKSYRRALTDLNWCARRKQPKVWRGE